MDKITGPIEGHGHAGVTDITSYKKVHASAMQAAEKDVFEVMSEVEAYISHGRWVVDCVCHGAGFTSPEFKVSCCFDCGRMYTSVVFPKQRKQIEEVLLSRRDKENRNWIPGELVKELILESEVT
jgi:hypothetical protein